MGNFIQAPWMKAPPLTMEIPIYYHAHDGIETRVPLVAN